MSELTKEKIYKKELEKVGGEGNNNLERIRSLAGGGSALEDIVDKNGNHRFIEGAGIPKTNLPGLTISYCKWSLSGTHLMLVLAGAFENASELPANTNIAVYSIPKYIYDKIYPVWQNNLEVKNIPSYAEDWGTQNIQFKLQKTPNVTLTIQTNNVTFTANRGFRVQFDLLIDNE